MKFTLRRRLIVRLGEALERSAAVALPAQVARPAVPDRDPHPAAAPQPLRPGAAARARLAAGRGRAASPSGATSRSGTPRPTRRTGRSSTRARARSAAGCSPATATFAAVPFLNLLGAAWLQFQVHDWVSHGKGDPSAQDPDPARRRATTGPQAEDGAMVVVALTSPARSRRRRGGPPVYDEQRHALVGRLPDLRQTPAEHERSLPRGRGRPAAPDRDGGLPPDPATGDPGAASTATGGSGLSLLHTALRQRAQRHLREAGRPPTTTDRRPELYDVARRVNAAVMAKIHTLEWTPADPAPPHRPRRDARTTGTGCSGRGARACCAASPAGTS